MEVGFNPHAGKVSDLCLVENDRPLVCAPLADPAAQGSFYADKFISFQASDALGDLGQAEVREAFVYDEQYRCDIDFTGLQLILTLRRSAFEQYDRFVRREPAPLSPTNGAAWHGDLLVQVPAPVFRFPDGRGSAPPYPPAGAQAGKIRTLRLIKRFRVDALDIIKIAPLRAGTLEMPDLLSLAPERVLHLR